MALTKNDLQSVGKIVDEKIDQRLKENNKKLRSEIKADTCVTVNKEIGLLRSEMNQRFDASDKKIDNVEHKILEKIDEVKKMESEDVQALAQDIEMIKGKLPA